MSGLPWYYDGISVAPDERDNRGSMGPTWVDSSGKAIDMPPAPTSGKYAPPWGREKCLRMIKRNVKNFKKRLPAYVVRFNAAYIRMKEGV